MPPSPSEPCQIRACVAEAVDVLRPPDATPVQVIFDPRVPAAMLCPGETLRLLLGHLLRTASPAPGELRLFVFEADDPHDCVLRFELHGKLTAPLPSEAAGVAAQLGGEAGGGLPSSVPVWFTIRTVGPKPVERRPESPGTRNPVLVVEDNLVNQRLAAECLRHLGYECRIAENGREAVDLAATDAFDVILMDIHMPVMDGITATRRIRSRPGGARPFIAALTAFALPGDRARCLESGMDDFLTKPCQLERLAAVLCKAEARRGKSDPGRL